MIRIVRAATPSVLLTSSSPTRYKDAKVIEALWVMQHEKCCYCEGYIPVSGAAKEVEHFRPQSKFPDLVNDWNNLLLACRACNNKKRANFPTTTSGDPLLLDPSDPLTDPQDHIEFVLDPNERASSLVGFSVPIDHDLKGTESIQVVGLNMSHHVKRRSDAIGHLSDQLLTLLTETKRDEHGMGDQQRKDDAKQNIQRATASDKEYARVARTFCRKRRLERYGISC